MKGINGNEIKLKIKEAVRKFAVEKHTFVLYNDSSVVFSYSPVSECNILSAGIGLHGSSICEVL